MNTKLIFVISIFSVLLVSSILDVSAGIGGGGGGKVFEVVHKFKGKEISMKNFIAHDKNRRAKKKHPHGVSISLGGDGVLLGTGLYYTSIGIGTPSKDYYVQVDTGSDIFWVNSFECKNCRKNSTLGIDLKLYDSRSSTTAKNVSCVDHFCTLDDVKCRDDNKTCGYESRYVDTSASSGYFVKDVIKINQVTGDFKTKSSKASVIFGCGVTQTGRIVRAENAVDGLIGFGQSNTSMISQLASSGIAKKKFAHCLNGANGGGIFVIGNVVHPTVKTTPLVPNKPHYNVNVISIKVGKETLLIPDQVLDLGTVIDSGASLAFLPTTIYEAFIYKIITSGGDLKVLFSSGNVCFNYTKSVDDVFPTITFQIQNSLELLVYPHDYLLRITQNFFCIGWKDGGIDLPIIIGDMVLNKKLVVYDLENQVIGWTNYNCSSSIQLKDDHTGSIYEVAYGNISTSPHSKHVP